MRKRQAKEQASEWPWWIRAKYVDFWRTDLSKARGIWKEEIATHAWKALLACGAIVHYSNTSGGPDVYERTVNMSALRKLLKQHFENSEVVNLQAELPGI